ncbi:MAG TPA: hypothetical protein VHV51_14215, partial [Polyangiaceae bacterium]|nr:hypothetical protein [Polyangiaceae bacterium]
FLNREEVSRGVRNGSATPNCDERYSECAFFYSRRTASKSSSKCRPRHFAPQISADSDELKRV